MELRHVIWDWNGTLLDDLSLIVDCVNGLLSELEAQAIDVDTYRTHYTRPVQRFYERVLGRPITPAEWHWIDTGFHATYAARAQAAPLAADCEEALAAIGARDATQSLLSMLPHEDLLPSVRRHDIERHMLCVDGVRGPRGEPKAPHLARHLARLRAQLPHIDADTCLMVGDSLDDALAASAHGVRCVLYTGGAHHRSELERTGMPVAGSLMEALRLAGL